MESPTRSRGDAPDSPTQSTKYSLDLDALNLDDTGVLSSIPSPKVDRLASDEIEGPSDFTINMSKWMNGAHQKRDRVPWSFDALVEENDAQQSEDAAQGEVDAGSRAPNDDTAESDMIGDTTNNVDVERSAGAYHQDTDNPHSPTYEAEEESALEGDANADDLLHEMTEGSLTPRQVEESSVWEPHYNSSSLRLSRPRSLLQPTVEDYNSELTPARPQPAAPPPVIRISPDPPRRAASASKMRPSSPGRPSSPTLLSPVRTPLPNRKESAPRAQNPEPQRPRVNRDDSRMAQEQAQEALKLLRVRLNEESLKNEALRSELEQAQRRQHQVEQASENARQHHQQELDRLSDELDSVQRSEHDALRIAEQRRKELDGARLAEREASQLAEDRARELDQMHESEDAELQEMRWQLQQAQDSHQEARDLLADLRRQMAEQGRAHDEEVQRLGRDLAAARSDAHAANESSQTAQNELRLIRQQRNEHATALRDETQRLRQELDEAQRQEESVRSEADRYYNELEDFRTSQKSAQSAGEATIVSSEDAVRRTEVLRQSLEKQLHESQTQLATLTRARKTDQDAKQKAEEERRRAEARAKEAEDGLKEAELKLSVAEENSRKAQEAAQTAQQQGQQAGHEKKEDRDSVALHQDLEKRLNQLQGQLAAAVRERKSAEEAKEKAEEEVGGLKEELDVMQNLSRLDDDRPDDDDDHDHDEEVKHDVPSKELEELNAAHDKALKEIERMKSQMRDAQARHEARVKSELIGVEARHRSELDTLEARHKSEQDAFRVKHKTKMSSLRARISSQLIAQKQTDAKLLTDLRNEHSRTLDLIEEGMVALRQDRSSLSEEVTTLKQNLERSQQLVESLKDIHDRASRADEVASLKEELERAQKQISTMKEDTRAFDKAVKRKAHDIMLRRDSHAPRSVEAIALEKQLRKAREEIESMKALNNEFDVVISDTINKREEKLRAKVKELLLKEQAWEEKAAEYQYYTDLMGKFIMRQWGREECGTIDNEGPNGELQRYVYKYSRKQRQELAAATDEAAAKRLAA